jgi:hypothetical protein
MNMLIRDFQRADFDRVVDCYSTGFPQGHNRYSLSRLVRFQSDTILVAEHEDQIVGTIIGISSHREAWLTGLSVLPGTPHAVSLHLMYALGKRFVEVGFAKAFATTSRRSVNSFARNIGATLVSVEQNYYFDGETKNLYEADLATLARLDRIVTARLKT